MPFKYALVADSLAWVGYSIFENTDAVLGAVKEAGYDGVWCCEYEGRENDGTGQNKCYEYLKTNLS